MERFDVAVVGAGAIATGLRAAKQVRTRFDRKGARR